MWSPDLPYTPECRKIKYLLPMYTRGRVLDIGCGTEKAFPHFIGVDNGHHFGKGAADLVMDADNLSLIASESVDAVFSSHVLEHMGDMGKALAEWGRVIKPGGHLILYVPSANLYPKCGEMGANPDHKHDLYPGDVERVIDGLPYYWCLVESEERPKADEYSIFIVLRKVAWSDHPPEGRPKILPDVTVPPAKTACVCRFGGWGDMLQTASVFPRLKEQGFHVTVMTTPKGKDVLFNDPHIDDWYIVDTDQIPNGELHAFWKVQSARFDRFINLSESIEGTLLALPGRVNHSWPHEVRKKRLNLNYMDFIAELAGVEFKPCRLFHPSDDEKEWAGRETDDNDTFWCLWALAGSSIHKFTPHQDTVIARMMLYMPECKVILVGDDACRILEQGWEGEKRVIRSSGKLGIRQTLALAERMDCVIGPETGVLNSVAYLDTVSKVLMLSHSSHNNLSKYWLKAQALTPKDTPCYPCHLLHYGDEYCNVDKETCAAMCAVNIGPDEIYEAIRKVYETWKRKRA